MGTNTNRRNRNEMKAQGRTELQNLPAGRLRFWGLNTGSFSSILDMMEHPNSHTEQAGMREC